MDGSLVAGVTAGAPLSRPIGGALGRGMCGKHFARCAHTAYPRALEILMATGLEHEQKELAQFIRQGSSRGPQCFGSYFDERGGSCALGAVYEGVYHLPRDHGKLIPDHLERLFRCLDEVTKRCPHECGKRLPLASMIVHLNDDHRLTREQIAEWLTLESNG
jgi:hypothetical protein